MLVSCGRFPKRAPSPKKSPFPNMSITFASWFSSAACKISTSPSSMTLKTLAGSPRRVYEVARAMIVTMGELLG